jgi:hypothetical protein
MTQTDTSWERQIDEVLIEASVRLGLQTLACQRAEQQGRPHLASAGEYMTYFLQEATGELLQALPQHGAKPYRQAADILTYVVQLASLGVRPADLPPDDYTRCAQRLVQSAYQHFLAQDSPVSELWAEDATWSVPDKERLSAAIIHVLAQGPYQGIRGFDLALTGEWYEADWYRHSYRLSLITWGTPEEVLRDAATATPAAR